MHMHAAQQCHDRSYRNSQEDHLGGRLKLLTKDAGPLARSRNQVDSDALARAYATPTYFIASYSWRGTRPEKRLSNRPRGLQLSKFVPTWRRKLGLIRLDAKVECRSCKSTQIARWLFRADTVRCFWWTETLNSIRSHALLAFAPETKQRSARTHSTTRDSSGLSMPPRTSGGAVCSRQLVHAP